MSFTYLNPAPVVRKLQHLILKLSIPMDLEHCFEIPSGSRGMEKACVELGTQLLMKLIRDLPQHAETRTSKNFLDCFVKCLSRRVEGALGCLEVPHC
jgi:hypothetical protein